MTKKDYWQTSSLKIKSQIKTRHSRAGFLDRHDAGILPERFSDIPKPDRHDAVRAFLERFQPAERLDEIREERFRKRKISEAKCLSQLLSTHLKPAEGEEHRLSVLHRGPKLRCILRRSRIRQRPFDLCKLIYDVKLLFQNICEKVSWSCIFTPKFINTKQDIGKAYILYFLIRSNGTQDVANVHILHRSHISQRSQAISGQLSGSLPDKCRTGHGPSAPQPSMRWGFPKCLRNLSSKRIVIFGSCLR